MLGLNTYDMLTKKAKLERNKAFLEVPNDSNEVIIIDPKRAVVILDIIS